MSFVYINEQGSNIGINGGRIEVRKKGEIIRSIPSETIDSIQLFGNVSVSSQCMAFFLQKGITLTYYSSHGKYYGRLVSPSHVNVARQRKQAKMGENEEFCLSLSKRIISAKIHNQEVILRRYARRSDLAIESAIREMKHMENHITACSSIPQLMGYEGTAAHIYFQTLGKLIIPEFSFSKRSRRPPLDAFNSMISLGYSIILNEIVGKLESKGLNPYFGFMHSDHENHPTLASDLMEEWRAVIVDSMAMSLANGHEISTDMFYQAEGEEGIFLTRDGFKIFINKMENKLRTDSRYIADVTYSMSFRRAMDYQISCYIKALEESNMELYKPVRIR